MTRTATDRHEPNFGHSAVRGYVIGFLVTTVAITVTGTLGGLGFGPSLGLGAFVGVWGGGGFGFMMGGTLPLARFLDVQSTHSAHHKETHHDPATRRHRPRLRRGHHRRTPQAARVPR